MILLLSSSGGASFDRAYFEQAWSNFINVINWMRTTTILSLGDVNFTFWNIGIGLLVFGIVSDFILNVFYN